MGSDCTLEIDGGLVNLRVGAIIMKDGKYLMAGNSKMDYLYTVGGRIKFGESAEDAVVREVFEETGVKMAVDRLGFVNENFFYSDVHYYPEFFREELKNPVKHVKHILTDERYS